MTVAPSAPKAFTIIRAKIAAPALPRDFVERPRLDELLAAVIRKRRMTVISATAGAGKTTALVSALRSMQSPVAWLTVDRTDVAPGRLVSYLEAGLAAVHPLLDGVATRAMAAGISHVEACGLLIQALPGSHTLLILDELERLERTSEAWAVIETVVRYAPSTLTLVLLSRRDIPADRCELPLGPELAVIGERELAFTPEEAAGALARLGTADIDAAAAVEATGGWVTGVLFEAWRSADHVAGAGGEADPLYGYLSSHILGKLSDPEREFLVAGSLLHEIDAASAWALGLPSPAATLSSLRAAHLPVSWSDDGRTMRLHSRFREYLLEQLERLPDDERRDLRMRYAAALADAGHHEEACEAYLLAGDAQAAREPAEAAIIRLIERLDLQIAERWLRQLAGCGPTGASPLRTAELMLSLLQDDIRRGIRVADELSALGERSLLAAESDLAAGLMAWCYLHAARTIDVDDVLAAAMPGPVTDIVRYATRAVRDGPGTDPPVSPAATGGPLDALICAADYFFGRLDRLLQPRSNPWADAVVRPWRIGALRATGQTEAALEIYQAAIAESSALPGLTLFIGPELLIEAGRRAEAVEALDAGRRMAAQSGSLALQGHARLVEAKLALNLDRDPAAARAALASAELQAAVSGFRFVAEVADGRYGHAYLLEADAERAAVHLRRAAAGMQAGYRFLELPTTAVHLAEAEWRLGDEDAADAAADLALAAAREQGSNHTLLAALAEFPAVLSRRLDAEAVADSAWHDIGRALLAQGSLRGVTLASRVRLREFGATELFVNDGEQRPKIAKSYALLAYLAAEQRPPTRRDALLDALFDGRKDPSSRAYLRQAIRHLRACLPDPADLRVDNEHVALAPGLVVTTDSLRFEARLAEAARRQREDRLAATLDALTIVEQGPYMPRVTAPWVAERRRVLEQLAADARFDAAETAYALADLRHAQELTDAVLRHDPFREPAWRLSMRLASALGSDERVIRDYQRCERALAELGAKPSAATRRMLDQLRR